MSAGEVHDPVAPCLASKGVLLLRQDRSRMRTLGRDRVDMAGAAGRCRVPAGLSPAADRRRGHRQSVRLLRRTLFRRAFDRYAARTLSLFDAIRSQTGKDIVIDFPLSCRGELCPSRDRAVDLRVIHLVRDGRGVAASMLRAPTRSTPRRASRRSSCPSPPPHGHPVVSCQPGGRDAAPKGRTAQRYLQIRYEDSSPIREPGSPPSEN